VQEALSRFGGMEGATQAPGINHEGGRKREDGRRSAHSREKLIV